MVGNKNKSFQQGFGLIDLLIVIMIIGILGTILTPQVHSILTEVKLNGATRELVSALEYTIASDPCTGAPIMVRDKPKRFIELTRLIVLKGTGAGL